jgi:hypothetical protein
MYIYKGLTALAELDGENRGGVRSHVQHSGARGQRAQTHGGHSCVILQHIHSQHVVLVTYMGA